VLSDQLRQALATRAKGTSLEELGRQWEVDPTVLGRFLRGQRGLNTETSDRICQGLSLVLAPKDALGGFQAAMAREEKDNKINLIKVAIAELRKEAANLREDAARLERIADDLEAA
jgi:hypothetical protein